MSELLDTVACVPDLVIHDVPADVLARIDRRAARAGISRAEYLRRLLHREAARRNASVDATDLKRFAVRHQDLGDAEVMRQAWS